MRRAILLYALLGGCALGPNYQRPSDDNVPAQFRSASGYQPSVTPTTPWWQDFRDPQLNELIARARSNNPDIARAQAAVASARAISDQAVAGGLPTLNATGSYQYGRTFPSPTYPERWQARYGFDAGWELDLWGKRRRAIESSRAQIESTEASADDAMLTMMGEVARFYINLRSAQEQLVIVQQSEANRLKDLSDVQTRYRFQDALRLEALQAETALLQTRSTLPTLNSQIALAENSLAILCGLAPGSLNLGPAPLPQPDFPSTGVPIDLLRRRPDVRLAERNLAAATAQVGVAIADMLPSFSLGGSINFSPGSLGAGPSAPIFALGPTVNLPLLDGGLRLAVIRQRRAQVEENQALYRSAVLNALRDTEDAVVRIRADRQQIARLDNALRVARQTAAAAREIYIGGGVEFLQVLSARQTLDNLLLTYAQARAALATDTVSLYKALAGGYRSQ